MKLILFLLLSIVVFGNKQFLNPSGNMFGYDMNFINNYDDSRPPEELPESMEKKWVNNDIDEKSKNLFIFLFIKVLKVILQFLIFSSHQCNKCKLKRQKLDLRMK